MKRDTFLSQHNDMQITQNRHVHGFPLHWLRRRPVSIDGCHWSATTDQRIDSPFIKTPEMPEVGRYPDGRRVLRGPTAAEVSRRRQQFLAFATVTVFRRVLVAGLCSAASADAQS